MAACIRIVRSSHDYVETPLRVCLRFWHLLQDSFAGQVVFQDVGLNASHTAESASFKSWLRDHCAPVHIFGTMALTADARLAKSLTAKKKLSWLAMPRSSPRFSTVSFCRIYR